MIPITTNPTASQVAEKLLIEENLCFILNRSILLLSLLRFLTPIKPLARNSLVSATCKEIFLSAIETKISLELKLRDIAAESRNSIRIIICIKNC